MTAAVAEPVLSAAEADRLTLKIRLLVGSIADQVDTVTALIEQAKTGQADVALGYTSWPAYCAAEFAAVLPRLERQQRLELVGSLTALGMSSRAIAPIVGVDQKTVLNDRRAGEENSSPGSESGGGRPITGRDGKTYTTPPKRRRRPLPDAYRDAIYELTKAIERTERLHADDRFAANRGGLQQAHRGDLAHIFSTLNEVMDDLGASPTDTDLRGIAAAWQGVA